MAGERNPLGLQDSKLVFPNFAHASDSRNVEDSHSMLENLNLNNPSFYKYLQPETLLGASRINGT